MSIPYSQFRDAPATAAVNAEFKAREDALLIAAWTLPNVKDQTAGT